MMRSLLFLLLWVHFQYSNARATNTIVSLNGTELLLKCPPAEELVRTHMAPDFENPQLVRRLDWFHDDRLVASYQQDTMADVSRQWWVANKRYELVKPFYMLKIQPLLAEDSGTYRCRLETDPLFALAVSTDSTSVVVMVRPPAPSKPQVTSYTEKSVTLNWGQSAATAHKPITRYSILISQVDSENIRVISTKSNSTTAVVSGLQPYTKYSFSVRAENAAGHSNFGPEVVFRTLGEPPSTAPIIVGIHNGTDGCVNVEWRSPPISNGQIVGYRVMVHRMGNGVMREWYLKGNRQSLCSLAHFSEYMLSIEGDNGFGYSPPATTKFLTDQKAPEGPPEQIQVRPLKADMAQISWYEPRVPNGIIKYYVVYYKEAQGQQTYKSVNLDVRAGDTSKSFSFNLKKLKPFTSYNLTLSAITAKGEGPKSRVVQFTTDHAVPAIPQVTNISYECNKDVSIHWMPRSSPVSFYRVLVSSSGKPATYNTTEQRMDLGGLAPKQRYSVQIAAVLRSIFNDNTFLESNFSKPEVFQIHDNCHIQSSICSTFNVNCVPITTQGNVNERSFLSFSMVFLGILFLISMGVIFLCMLKKHCTLVKQYLKKTDRKFPQESISLVYDANDPIINETVTAGRFEKYFEEMSANDNELFKQQFEEIEAMTANAPDESETSVQENKLKNRYLNIGAIESTRIRIHASGGTSDYINANYVDSCDSKKAFIATQAPLPHTFVDFWTMVSQEKSNIIVVITNMVEKGRRKCDQYWPSTPQTPSQFGPYQVTLSSELHNANFVHRILHLKSSNCVLPERTIHQVHFTSWPDHGVPSTVFPLLSFMNYVAEIQSTGPIVVHCSAGVGRSGSYILIDSMRKHLLQCDRINIQAHLKHIRKQRAKLVQTAEQYIFCHYVIRELIRHGISRQPVLNFSYYVNFLYSQQMPDGRTRMQMQYEDVCKCPHTPSCEIDVGCTALPGYHRNNEFLVGNWPVACEELWSALWEHNCQTILLIGSDIEVGDYFASYLTQNGSQSSANGIRVELREENQFWLHNSEDELCVKVVRVQPSVFEVDFWGEMERIQEEVLQYHNCQMMLIDKSSSSTAYILCALQSAACQLEQERYVDVLPFISTYRYLRCGCWKSQSNVEYIYDKLMQLALFQHRR